jgi:ryanodine receptor 2
MMDSPHALESDTALALNRYLCNSVLPLLTNHSHYFAEADHHAALLDATLHTVIFSPIHPINLSKYINCRCIE